MSAFSKRARRSAAVGIAAFALVAAGGGGLPYLSNPAAHAADPTGAVVPAAPGSSVDNAINADAFDISHAGQPGFLPEWARREDTFDRSQGGGTITGIVNVADNAIVNQTNGGANNTAAPGGITVYMQWMDTDGQISPIYKTRTYDANDLGDNPQGAYGFAVPTWTDDNGVLHAFVPKLVDGPQVRMWFEPYLSEAGNEIAPLRTALHAPMSFIKMNNLTGSYSVVMRINNYWNNLTLTGYEMPGTAKIVDDNPSTFSYMTKPKDEWHTSPMVSVEEPSDKSSAIYGGVFPQTSQNWGSIGTAPGYGNATDADFQSLDGYSVVFTSLTFAGVQAVQAIRARPPETIASETAKLFKEHPEYIAETVQTPIRPDNGRFFVKFQTPLDETTRQYLYGFVMDPNGNIDPSISRFSTPIFASVNGNSSLSAAPVPQPLPAVSGWNNVFFAINPYVNPIINIPDYDTQGRPAVAGDQVKVQITGTLSPGGTVIRWKDQDGNILDEPAPVTIDSTDDPNIAKATFTVPDDAQNGQHYTVELVKAGDVISQDDFAVNAPQADPSQLFYQGVKLVDGNGDPIDAGQFVGDDGAVLSDGSSSRDDGELQVTYQGNTADLSTLGVTVTDAEGNTYDANKGETGASSAWQGAYGSPVVRNFGGTLFGTASGSNTYGVSISENIPFWAPVTKGADLVSGDDSLTLDGATSTRYVVLGFDGNNNGIADVDEAPVADYTPVYGSEPVVKAGDQAGQTSDVSYDGTAPEDGVATYALQDGYTAPDGWTVTVDSTTGQVKAVAAAPGADGADDEEISVPVTVTYSDGAVTDTATAKFLLDSDSDGIPDTTDPDDDNDDVPDVQEQADGTDPKDSADKIATKDRVEPSYGDATVEQGKFAVVDAPTFHDQDDSSATADIPDGTKFQRTDQTPSWATVLGDGTIIVVPGTDVDADTYEVPVEVKYADGSSDTVNATVAVTAAEEASEEEPATPANTVASQYDPKYDAIPSVLQGKQGTIAKPSFYDENGKKVDLPDGVTVTFADGDNFDWTTMADDGSFTVSPAIDQPIGEYDIPVTVTYAKNGETDSSETVLATFIVTPVNDYKPNYGGEAPVVKAGDETGKTVQVSYTGTAPKDGVASYQLKDGWTPPKGWTVDVDPKTGTVTAKAGPAGPDGADVETLEVPITITYNDGAVTDEVTATFLLDTDGDGIPDATDPDDDGDNVPDEQETADGTDPKDPGSKRPATDGADPNYPGGSGNPGTTVKVPGPTFDDPMTKDTVEKNPAPEGTTFAPGDPDQPGVSVDSNTGEVSVVVPKDAKPGTKITVPVVVTYPDKSTDETSVTVTVGNPPAYDSGTAKPGESVTLANKGGAVPDGSSVTVEGPGTATVGEDGSITVTPNKDAKPGEKVTVSLKDPDGNVIATVSVTVATPDVTNAADTTLTRPVSLPDTGALGPIGAIGLIAALFGLTAFTWRRNRK